jgi:hypothetical protein
MSYLYQNVALFCTLFSRFLVILWFRLMKYETGSIWTFFVKIHLLFHQIFLELFFLRSRAYFFRRQSAAVAGCISDRCCHQIDSPTRCEIWRAKVQPIYGVLPYILSTNQLSYLEACFLINKNLAQDILEYLQRGGIFRTDIPMNRIC